MSPPDASVIGARVRAGVLWKGASQLVLQLSRVAVALVLARLLAPEDWGLAAMVLVFTGFGVVLTDSALGVALVQRRDVGDVDCSTVFWANAAIGGLLLAVGIACAGPLASFYGEPDVEGLFVVTSVGFLVASLGSTHVAWLTREMRFGTLEVRQMCATATGAATGVAVALGGGGAWAIVGMTFAEAVASTLLLWLLTPWRPGLVFSWRSLRRLAAFAANVLGENALYQGGRNLPPLLIGRVLGAAPLGAFTLATSLILVPFSRLAAPLQQVFFPAFARLTDERERVADLWVRATRLVAFVAMPSLVGLAIVAEEFVGVVLGGRWALVATLVQILAVVGIVQSLQTLNGEVLLALDRAATLLRFTLLWFVATVAAVAVGLAWGIEAVVAAYAAAVLAIEPIRTLVTTRALGIPFSAFLRPLAGVVQATVLMATVLLVARALLVEQGAGGGARLALLVPLGAAVYTVAATWLAAGALEDIRQGLRGRRAREAPPPPREAVEPL